MNIFLLLAGSMLCLPQYLGTKDYGN